MSVVVAIKQNDTVYMGADTQCTSGSRKSTMMQPSMYKIARYPNGVLVGFCGAVYAIQFLQNFPDLFTLDQDGKLTKNHIVNNVIPKLVENIKHIGDQSGKVIDVSMVIAHKDKLYRIFPDLCVLSINQSTSIGAGKYYTLYALSNSHCG